jgi:hypothetical protein
MRLDEYQIANALIDTRLVMTSRLVVINRTTHNKRLYRDESGGITSAF